jgi:hypothetical protein
MSPRAASRKRTGLVWIAAAVVSMLGLAAGTAAAQRLVGAQDNGPNVARGAVDLPPTPPQGAWGEVIMANAKWLVIQNHEGQQFPIAADAVSQFLIRWPTSLRDLTPESVIEAIGQDVGSNALRTDHVDVFERENRTLVTPTYTSILPNNRVVTTIDPGYNRFMNTFDVGAQNLLYGWAYPVAAGELGIPARLHVVGNVLNTNPLRIGVPGNNFATVLPTEPGGPVLTEITRGDPSYAEKGDLAFLMPTDLTTRTVVLSQLVLYKKIPFRQFQPR